ncbi:MAG TPA: outer membrane lipoprotein chaperone LolA [Thermodesulfovibrionia bacterium]|nr:outer membrane lipoprotein chaperone LolA [Thermodesulfovibrionia bacterium]
MNTLLKISFVLLLTFYPFMSGWAQVEDVRAIQERYNTIKEIQGDFIQKSYIKDLEETQEFKGQFSIKLPSKMRWAYTEPRDEEVIINDTTIWIYKIVEKQAIKSKFNADTYGQAPIALLAGFGNLEKDFVVSKVESDVLQLQPKQAMGAIKTLFVKLSKRDFPISSLTLIDVYGNEITIVVNSIKVNKDIEDSFFDFTPPQNVEVYEFGNQP